MKKLKRYLWCKSHKSHYPLSENLQFLINDLIIIINDCDNVKVEIDYYYITVITPSCKVVFWNANKFYTWLSAGEVNGVKFDRVGPPSESMYDFKECLKNKGYNIYVSYTDPLDINIKDLQNVKC